MIALILFALLSLDDKIQQSAVHLVTQNTECSGVLISPTKILTAKHCTREPADYIEIGGSRKRYLGFGKVTRSKTADLATIELIDAVPQPVAELSQNAPIRGDAFTVIGLSYDVPWALSRGFVMTVVPQGVKYEHDAITYHAQVLACQGCDEGDSGAGVFNSAGELIGVFIASSENGVRTYMASLEDVRSFLHVFTNPGKDQAAH